MGLGRLKGLHLVLEGGSWVLRPGLGLWLWQMGLCLQLGVGLGWHRLGESVPQGLVQKLRRLRGLR